MKHAQTFPSRRTSRSPTGATDYRDDSLVAGVLVGGRSRRFGSPKALMRMPDRGTMVEHIVRVAQQVAGSVVLVGEAASLPPSLACLPRLPDDPRGSGPAAGLAALLQYASVRAARPELVADRWALLLSCDLPRLIPESLAPLLAVPRKSVDIVAFRAAPVDGSHGGRGKFETCCALYHSRLLPLVRSSLVNATGSMQGVFARVRVATAALPLETADALRDIDTQHDAADFLGRELPATPILVP